MVTELTLHPLVMLFPEATEEEYASLKEDIRVNGLMNPVSLYKGEILDGRHRYKACRELADETGEDFLEVEILKDNINPLDFVLGVNLQRRHLMKPYQKAMVAARAKEFTR